MHVHYIHEHVHVCTCIHMYMYIQIYIIVCVGKAVNKYCTHTMYILYLHGLCHHMAARYQGVWFPLHCCERRVTSYRTDNDMLTPSLPPRPPEETGDAVGTCIHNVQ